MGIVLIKGLRRYAVVYVTRPTLILLDDAASQPLQRTNYVLVHLSKARSCPAERPVFCVLSFGLGGNLLSEWVLGPVPVLSPSGKVWTRTGSNCLGRDWGPGSRLLLASVGRALKYDIQTQPGKSPLPDISIDYLPLVEALLTPSIYLS